ncbi:tetrathionate hydrolase [Acidiferrobacter sp. SPIII_3]|jgi:outer membrane protein assembly factor BamB|uniref:outer membrane protein assembly factor BamB family protein n=1 Tax=Acidiferrobacter sp. SPIII_3 TaxID=1281578 RepID=UPI000D7323F9|nr:PQQ-binding-like beta-propeller repeat protein [Acidiferrobacter sp. SPIII_3]AWP23642.1 tetrathionate hydrolase [Acidiferrobacter sp. SPIII_3]
MPDILPRLMGVAATLFAGPLIATAALVPGSQHGPYARVFHPRNLPPPAAQAGFPRAWTHAYGNARHDSAYPVGPSAPAWLKNGVTWRYAEARAWPLSRHKPFGAKVYGDRLALATMTQFYGNALGVSAVDGIIYAESDDEFAYALNARTGRLIWRTSPVGNTFMGDPLISGHVVYLTVGNVGFNFSNVQRYSQKTAARGAGVSYNGVYALDRITGKLLWHFGTMGATMPTPAIAGNRLFIDTGSGDIYAINAQTGHQIWVKRAGGIANMSDPAVYHGHVYVALSVVPYLYCLSAENGHIVWKASIRRATKTGLGDVSPAVAHGVVVMDAVAVVPSHGGRTTMTTIVRAYNAEDGHVLWTHAMGLGPKPPAFKGGVPMIHGNTVYVGTPVDNIYQAYDLHSGKVLWTWHIPKAGAAGAGRGPATYSDGKLFISTGPRLFVLNAHTGRLIGQKYLGGRFGIVNPVIVGGTIYLDNSWDWIMAVPVSAVVAHKPIHRQLSP